MNIKFENQNEAGGSSPRSQGVNDIDRLIELLARLPGLGPRSARRAALYLLERKREALGPLAHIMGGLVESVRACVICGNITSGESCPICADERREKHVICVVESVSDLWAIERAGFFRGQYHVLGGLLSAFDRVGPEELRLPYLEKRVREEGIGEIVLALGATIDGQTTAHYINDLFKSSTLTITMLAKGVPLGSELEYLDEGTIETAFHSRQGFGGAPK